MKQLLYKYRHAVALLYLPLYLISFFTLERVVHQNSDFYVVYCPLDDLIPFCEYFAIPYFLWFAYIAATLIFFFFADKKDFFRVCVFLFTGMTLCLVIYAIWPNGHHLRPDLDALGRDNIFISMLRGLYNTDTSTNVCPSIHALNSIGACIALVRCNCLKKHKVVRGFVVVLTIAICLSTVFLKQHSIVDVICAIIVAIPLYFLAYGPKYTRIMNHLSDDLVKSK